MIKINCIYMFSLNPIFDAWDYDQKSCYLVFFHYNKIFFVTNYIISITIWVKNDFTLFNCTWISECLSIWFVLIWFNDISAQVCAKPDDHVLQHDLRTSDLMCKVHTGQCHNCSYVINGVEIVQNLNISKFYIRLGWFFVLKLKTSIDFLV